MNDTIEQPIDRFEEFRSAYPKRAGANAWPWCQKRCRMLIANEEVTWDELIDGAKRYKKFMQFTGKEQTEYVLMPRTWLGENLQGWAEDWDLPVDANAPRLLSESQKREAMINKQGLEEGLTRDAYQSLDSFSDRVRKSYLARLASKQPEQPARQAAPSAVVDLTSLANKLRMAR